jgi:hypothetical protein
MTGTLNLLDSHSRGRIWTTSTLCSYRSPTSTHTPFNLSSPPFDLRNPLLIIQATVRLRHRRCPIGDGSVGRPGRPSADDRLPIPLRTCPGGQSSPRYPPVGRGPGPLQDYSGGQGSAGILSVGAGLTSPLRDCTSASPAVLLLPPSPPRFLHDLMDLLFRLGALVDILVFLLFRQLAAQQPALRGIDLHRYKDFLEP